MQEPGITAVIPLTCTSAIWASTLWYPLLGLLRVLSHGWLQRLMEGILFLSLFFSDTRGFVCFLIFTLLYYFKTFIYSAVLHLSCGMQYLSLRHANSVFQRAGPSSWYPVVGAQSL